MEAQLGLADRPFIALAGSDATVASAFRRAGLVRIEDLEDHEAIKRAYRRLARTVHPDLHPDVDEDDRKTLERRFAELTEAYETLVTA